MEYSGVLQAPNYLIFKVWVLVIPFCACPGVLPTTQFAYQKGLGIYGSLLLMAHTLQNALENGQEARIVQIDFSAANDRVNHLEFSISSFLWVCCTRSCVTQCTRFVALYLCLMCQSGLHAVL